VAGLLELARRLVDDRPAGVEVILLVPGGEEAAMVGMTQWVRRYRKQLDRRATLFLGFDSIGSGQPAISVKEGATGRFRKRDLALADAAADRAGLRRPNRFGLGAATDPLVARYAGFAALSIISQRDGGIANLHLPSDVPENVDWGCAEECIALASAIVEVWTSEVLESEVNRA
jgi:Zn-dependent M28 family amino/carboxypeptidase